MFRVWLQKSPTASWEKLCEALEEAKDVSRAHSLREKYCCSMHQPEEVEGTKQGERQAELLGSEPIIAGHTKGTSTVLPSSPKFKQEVAGTITILDTVEHKMSEGNEVPLNYTDAACIVY